MDGKKQNVGFFSGLVAGVVLTGTVVLALGGFKNINVQTNNNNQAAIVANKQTVQPSTQPSASNRPTTQNQINIAVLPTDHILGNVNAPITLIEFSDFQCPYCQRFAPTVKQIMKTYGDKIRLIYRHYPLPFHTNAQIAAEASECAADQGKFWEYHDILFENSQGDGTGLNAADLTKYAADLKLDVKKFNDCLASGKFKSKVSADLASGQVAGIQGTPGTVLIDKNGQTQLITGALPFEQIKPALDAAVNE